VKGLPIPAASRTDKLRLTQLAGKATKATVEADGFALATVEHEIDEIVARLYDLTPDEIGQIRTDLANTRRPSSDNNDNDNDS
jgi:hypothetical protein